jgi:hypothetical protein
LMFADWREKDEAKRSDIRGDRGRGDRGH